MIDVAHSSSDVLEALENLRHQSQKFSDILRGRARATLDDRAAGHPLHLHASAEETNPRPWRKSCDGRNMHKGMC